MKQYFDYSGQPRQTPANMNIFPQRRVLSRAEFLEYLSDGVISGFAFEDAPFVKTATRDFFDAASRITSLIELNQALISTFNEDGPMEACDDFYDMQVDAYNYAYQRLATTIDLDGRGRIYVGVKLPMKAIEYCYVRAEKTPMPVIF